MDKWQMDSLRHELVDVDFLLPNGLFCTLTFSRYSVVFFLFVVVLLLRFSTNVLN